MIFAFVIPVDCDGETVGDYNEVAVLAMVHVCYTRIGGQGREGQGGHPDEIDFKTLKILTTGTSKDTKTVLGCFGDYK